ncbi:hypothetical protein EYC98_20880 [Halieaceae bacterium IMCC14734]|uniref:Uncharacterized protein n=1 Tax=Candidatus Litorirhabdus singularis TaxID=2518993 RepID=A0ABT3TLV6_9GAMM|nr:DUF6776 family protein [Candidatus Litorirhabdus singularis]MCX2983322.1 hypothetical protein [Candidatus Litorirhabdus singularis]
MRRSVVVQQHPHHRYRLIFLTATTAAALFIGGYFIGAYGSLNRLLTDSNELQTLRERVMATESDLEQQRLWRVMRETRDDIESDALELVRQDLAEQQALVLELDRAVKFYKGLMAPDELESGLSVHSIDLRAGALPGRYQFRILAQQSARKHQLLIGTLRVEVEGAAGEVATQLELSDLSAEVPSRDIKLRFKYFQAVEGELELPEGFVPRKLVIYAKATKPAKVEFSREFPWVVEE